MGSAPAPGRPKARPAGFCPAVARLDRIAQFAGIKYICSGHTADPSMEKSSGLKCIESEPGKDRQLIGGIHSLEIVGGIGFGKAEILGFL